ncbi:hypothetical protein BC938DRAFT_470573 [Jimgerdemannia flammicorona]|uniref:Uncharacterized protein n=1 Tax=Jimgerdemannia flammicorona TaxID=994334 RepID=A0A433QV63_9FUNG|nr:hypothetical protein BC938DRAFT_470573 [Jimgerdemannia flammicorona]
MFTKAIKYHFSVQLPIIACSTPPTHPLTHPPIHPPPSTHSSTHSPIHPPIHPPTCSASCTSSSSHAVSVPRCIPWVIESSTLSKSPTRLLSLTAQTGSMWKFSKGSSSTSASESGSGPGECSIGGGGARDEEAIGAMVSRWSENLVSWPLLRAGG